MGEGSFAAASAVWRFFSLLLISLGIGSKVNWGFRTNIGGGGEQSKARPSYQPDNTLETPAARHAGSDGGKPA